MRRRAGFPPWISTRSRSTACRPRSGWPRRKPSPRTCSTPATSREAFSEFTPSHSPPQPASLAARPRRRPHGGARRPAALAAVLARSTRLRRPALAREQLRDLGVVDLLDLVAGVADLLLAVLAGPLEHD